MDTLFEDLIPSVDELELKNLDNLFNDKDFHLIYIDDDGNMSLVTPFGNESVKEKVKEYRCISHVWLTGDGKDHVWKDHDWDDKGIKHEGHKVDGVTWKVEVRKEKRERVMQVFNHHKGYFWMDVLCTNQDTDDKPLDVMGDIYRKCKECICLLDYICDVPGFDSERELWIDIAKDVKEYIGSNRERLDNKYEKLHKRKWFPDNDNGSSSDILFGTKLSQYLESIGNAEWFNRVWTWQEAALPPKVLFCSEEVGQYRYDPYSPELLRNLFPYKCVEKDILERSCREFYDSDDPNSYDDEGDVSDKLEYYDIADHLILLKFSSMKRKDIWDNAKTMFVSRKKCTNMEDYVYGVTGILDITIPKGLPLDKAVVKLEKGLQKYGILNLKDGGHPERPNSLRGLYEYKRFVDGIRMIGEVDIATLGKFSTNLYIHGYEEYKISSKEGPTGRGYVYYTCTHKTRTYSVGLETDRLNVGDILKTTKVGRKGCTFRGYAGFTNDRFSKIVNGKIESVGTIWRLRDDGYDSADDSEEYEE